MGAFDLRDLETIVAERIRTGDPKSSWTAKLHAGGVERTAKKLGEEAIETVIAALSSGPDALISESADMLYHWLVMLAVRGVSVSDVMSELERRTAQSGIDEKKSRRS